MDKSSGSQHVATCALLPRSSRAEDTRSTRRVLTNQYRFLRSQELGFAALVLFPIGAGEFLRSVLHADEAALLATLLFQPTGNLLFSH